MLFLKSQYRLVNPCKVALRQPIGFVPSTVLGSTPRLRLYKAIDLFPTSWNA